MGKNVTFDYAKASCFISDEELKNMKAAAECAKEVLVSKSGG